MTDLWVEATHDGEREERDRSMISAREALADLFPFLTGADSRTDYVNRKALVADRIAAAVKESGVDRAALEAALDEDFTKAAALRPKSAQGAYYTIEWSGGQGNSGGYGTRQEAVNEALEGGDPQAAIFANYSNGSDEFIGYAAQLDEESLGYQGSKTADFAQRLDSMEPNQKVGLIFHEPGYNGGPYVESAYFMGITGSGDERKAKFRSVDLHDHSQYEWEAYRYGGGWAYGSSAGRLQIIPFGEIGNYVGQYRPGDIIARRRKVALRRALGAHKTGQEKYPDIEVQLVGEDGNAFAILGRVSQALRRGGVPKEEIDQFYAEATAGDYDQLLQTVMKWVVVASKKTALSAECANSYCGHSVSDHASGGGPGPGKMGGCSKCRCASFATELTIAEQDRLDLQGSRKTAAEAPWIVFDTEDGEFESWKGHQARITRAEFDPERPFHWVAWTEGVDGVMVGEGETRTFADAQKAVEDRINLLTWGEKSGSKTAQDDESGLWRDAYLIAYVGASNPKGVQNTISNWLAQGVSPDHQAIRAMQGHLDFLNGISIGPDTASWNELMKHVPEWEAHFKSSRSQRSARRRPFGKIAQSLELEELPGLSDSELQGELELHRSTLNAYSEGMSAEDIKYLEDTISAILAEQRQRGKAGKRTAGSGHYQCQRCGFEYYTGNVIKLTCPMCGSDEIADVGASKLFTPGAIASRKKAEQITDPTRSFTLSPDTENWIGNFSDEALAEMERFWGSAEGEATQPNLPGYAPATLKLIQDEKARRSASRKTAETFTCGLCSNPATHYVYQEGTRASGFFCCDRHVERYSEGRVVEKIGKQVMASHKQAWWEKTDSITWVMKEPEGEGVINQDDEGGFSWNITGPGPEYDLLVAGRAYTIETAKLHVENAFMQIQAEGGSRRSARNLPFGLRSWSQVPVIR